MLWWIQEMFSMSSLAELTFKSSATFSFIEEIGRGGMGIVYLAEKHCEGVSDLVVIKTIRFMTDRQLERLKREANIAAALRHENIVRSYGMESIPFEKLPIAFQEEISNLKKEPRRRRSRSKSKEIISNMRMGRTPPFIESAESQVVIEHDQNVHHGKRVYLMIMDYIEGWDLREILTKHIKNGLLIPIPLGAFIVSRICRSLEYAHRFLVHRDISPENILINALGVAKLTDFGIAVAADQEIYGMAGKVQYMAPEQIKRDMVDNRSDIFSLGLMAYHLTTGISLFLCPKDLSFKEQAAFYKTILEKEIVPPHSVCKDVPETYSRIIMKMLELEPTERYQDVEQAGNDIEKKYLYAKGFGPTNNSLAAYLKIFESDFHDYTKQDLAQLSFMATGDHKIHIRRKLNRTLYTAAGKRMLQDRRIQHNHKNSQLLKKE